jgi:hypothetical protein
MFKFKNIIISEADSVDKDTGNLSLFNIFNTISASAFPIVMSKIVITVIVERESSDKLDGDIEFVMKQNGEICFKQTVAFLFNEDTYGTNLIIKLNNLVIEEPGKMEFIIKCDDETIANSLTVMPIETKN